MVSRPSFAMSLLPPVILFLLCLLSLPPRLQPPPPRRRRPPPADRPPPPARGTPLWGWGWERRLRSEEHTSELQSHSDLVCRLLLEKKKKRYINRFAAVV